ncbi:MAG: hypothetical protein C0617_02845 [Desulfuromonas sp.]|uniref:OmpA family protein n=1 Tax=Desulfuromonas sp. TaxID=892 RepID=UPI000CC77B2D|nr:OmpA family protein [Desulfuromonas sp.]PLX85823.1 MAG: hypothetical protein C0617_02845 [Desulfuromonas sp.]
MRHCLISLLLFGLFAPAAFAAGEEAARPVSPMIISKKIILGPQPEAQPEPKPLLAPPKKRISDEVIAADRSQLASVQDRLGEINRRGVEVDSYHFAKAQAWLDFARSNYNENDRSSVVEEALTEALRLVIGFEDGLSPVEMGTETPVIPQSMRVREDLWALAAGMKADPGRFPCVEGLVAQLEVQLVWSGHEEKEMGWRHSKPYISAAERMARKIRRQAAECAVAAPPIPVPAPPPECTECPACPEPPQAPAARLPDSVHFALDSAEISPATAAVLDRVASTLTASPGSALEIHGHADVRGGRGYNDKLSRRRAEAVMSYLVSRGIDAGRLSVKAFSETAPRIADPDSWGHAMNRRVEFNFQGIETLTLVEQRDDLQVEGAARSGKGKH